MYDQEVVDFCLDVKTRMVNGTLRRGWLWSEDARVQMPFFTSEQCTQMYELMWLLDCQCGIYPDKDCNFFLLYRSSTGISLPDYDMEELKQDCLCWRLFSSTRTLEEGLRVCIEEILPKLPNPPVYDEDGFLVTEE
jgi:hypothetical protein